MQRHAGGDQHAYLGSPPARSALMFTNKSRDAKTICAAWNKELIVKVTNDYSACIAFRGIIYMDFTSVVNNPFSVINKTEISW